MPSSVEPYKDFTVEHGQTYKYKLCQFNNQGILATIGFTNEIYVDFEDMFLYDGKRQLRIRFNPKVSSFKNDILESKLDTIGSKYPFFFRNGIVNYKEFPISGLISYWMDNDELFMPLSKLNLSTENNVRQYTPTYPAYEVQRVDERIRYWIQDIDPKTGLPKVNQDTGEEEGQWTPWYVNGSIWDMTDYPHNNREYRDELGRHIIVEYHTQVLNEWTAVTEE
jgi:hypothetical protein